MEADADFSSLLTQHLQEASVKCELRRTDSAAATRAALEDFRPHLVLTNFDVPGFAGPAVQTLAREVAPQVPLLFVTDRLDGELVVEVMRNGAVDVVFKSHLPRLGAAIHEAVRRFYLRFSQEMHEAKLERLNRILSLSNTMSDHITRIRDRTELLQEACRSAANTQDYDTAFAIWQASATGLLTLAASAGRGDSQVARMRQAALTAAATASTRLGQVMSSGQPMVIRGDEGAPAEGSFEAALLGAEFRSAVALPLRVESTVVGMLLLCAPQREYFSTSELALHRDMADHLSFGIESIQKETMVRFLSMFDPHTGLARRKLYCDTFARAIANATRSTRVAAAILDVEGLGVLNDAFGYGTGDRLIREIATRLKAAFANHLELGHLGGGKFVLMHDFTTLSAKTTESMLGVIRALVEPHFSEPFVVDDRSIPVSIRIGLAMFPSDGTSAEQVLRNAETALRHGRASGSRYVHYRAEQTEAVVARFATLHNLKQALERREFEVHYQPKVNIITRRLQGVEALLRWNAPGRDLVPPAEFMPLLESSGLILDVGRWAISQVAADCQRWQLGGLPPVRVAINVTTAQLREGQFSSVFNRAIAVWSTRTWGLDLEMREGTFTDENAAEVRKLAQLRAVGVKIAIDGFGTGFSSLGRLGSLPVDSLKIDRSFIAQLEREPRTRILVKSIIDLAKALGLKTVAEGVQSQEQLDMLWHMGCDQSQGYLHSRPVPAETLEKLFQHGQGNLLLPPEREEEDPGLPGRARNG